nr:hypothetical protein [Tanacetum cinerariifolium]
MDDPNITMEEYIRLEEEKARRNGKVYNWETATYGKFWYDEDVHDLRSVETEFLAIVFDDALTSKVMPSYEPTEVNTSTLGLDNVQIVNTPYPWGLDTLYRQSGKTDSIKIQNTLWVVSRQALLFTEKSLS